ncbi:MAG: hypothetical protein L3J34_00450 [Flavobacteriaceae bacterium]|nr:hypothetical protein [Flavobacteriaceae bacterium]
MHYKKFLILVLFIALYNISSAQVTSSKFNKITVKEILQVSSYTYLFVDEGAENKWLAVPYFDAKIGGVYYYKGGMEMVNFESKELNKTFESVYFISAIYDNPFEEKKTTYKHATDADLKNDSQQKNEKLNLKLKPLEGGVSIAELFKNKNQYSGKKIKIKGQVTKFSMQVMRKNWIHLQDGTDYNNNFDLTLTSNAEVKVGDIIVLEGIVYLDKDFGYGYFYELIIENAILIK